MKIFAVKVDNQGQIELPVEAMEALGVRQDDVLILVVDGDQVRLSPAAMTLEETFGSVTAKSRPLSFEEQIREAKAEKVEREFKLHRDA